MEYKGFTYTPTSKTAWDNLSMLEKSEIMKVAVKNGITDLKTIREKYNEFAEGGNLYAGVPTDDDLVDFLIKEEGFIPHPKDIGDGKITLGSGLTAQKWHDLYKKRGNKWSSADNRKAVAEEVATRRRWAESNIPNWDSLPSSSQKALLAYKYNYDFTKENSPKLFKALSDSNLYEAAKQMDATSKDPQFKKGLMARRKREQNWFLSDVAPRSAQDYQMPVTTEQPVSTTVVNPFVTKMEYTQRLPIMVPDEGSYITAHEVSPSEQRATEIQNAFNAITNIQRFLKAISIPENHVPEYKPKNAPYVVRALGGPLVEAVMNEYKNGGGIHIKPSHRGRLTELKKRTGKTEAELYNDGNPAHKKMVVFARSARKWKRGLGGNLFDGTSQPTQQMHIGLDVQGWPDYTTEQIIAYGDENERRRKALENAYLNFITESNDATAVASGRPQNKHLEERGIKGAKAHRAWEEEHPTATQWSNVLGAVPFAVAAYPLAATAGSGIAALGDAAAATSVGQGITNFLAPIATTSYAGATVPQLLDLGLTSGFGAHGIQTAIDEGGVSPMTALEVVPLGRLAKPMFNETAKAVKNYRILAEESPAAEWTETSNHNLFYPSDTQFAIGDRFLSKVFNHHRLSEQDVRKALFEAEEYKASEGYANLIENARKESKELGFGDFPSSLFSYRTRSKPTIILQKRPEHKIGGYRKTTNTLSIDPNQVKSGEEIPFHEGIHWQRVGNPEGPLYEDWAKSYDAKSPKDIQDAKFSVFYNSPELVGRDNATNYLNYKIDNALYKDAGPYLREPGELQTLGVETGKALGIKPFEEYPGFEKTKKALDKAREYSNWWWDVRAITDKDMQTVWKLLTGNLAPATLPIGITIGTTLNKDKKGINDENFKR